MLSIKLQEQGHRTGGPRQPPLHAPAGGDPARRLDRAAMRVPLERPEERLDDRHLIEQILAGSPQAERAFYDAHVDRVFRLAYRMTGDETLAQEYTQESFVRAFSSLRGFRGDARLLPLQRES